MRKINLYLLLQQRNNRRLLAKNRTAGFFNPLGLGVLALCLILFAGASLAAGWEYTRITAGLPSVENLPVLLDRQEGDLLTPTRIYDRSGTILLAEINEPQLTQKFLSVDPDVEEHFSPQLIRVATAQLQPDFWQSPGYDRSHLLDPQPRTIAERLVSSLLQTKNSNTAVQALQMHILAAQVVSRYGRTQVLEWFLNSASLGKGAYGFETAAQLYLGKSARDLTLAESALLVSLVDSPALNPLDSPAAARDLAAQTLLSLASSGSVPQAEVKTALQEKLVFQQKSTVVSEESAFVKEVEAQLSHFYSVDRLERGGLILITTLDADLQSQLLCATRSQLFRIENSSYSGIAPEEADCPSALLLPTQNYAAESVQDLSASGVIVDPETGQVLAYQPTISLFSRTNTTASYQPGSLLSPVIALAGLARGESPSSLLWDVPSSLPSGLLNAANPDGKFHGPVDLRYAVDNDYLAAMSSLSNQVSSAAIWQMGSGLGLDGSVDPMLDSSWLFSGGEVSLLHLSQAYATLANSGSRTGIKDPATGEINLSLVLQVKTASGDILFDWSKPDSQSVLSESLSYLMNHILSDSAARRPSLGYPNALEISRPAAAKIGQTQSRDQIWTVGYTPHRLVLIGMHAEGAALQPTMAAGLWNAMIQYASRDLPADDWARPAGVTEMQVCFPSGMLPTADCPEIVKEVFLSGNEPVSLDTLYQKVKINRETGLLATIFTPATLVEEKITLNVPVEVRPWAQAAGLNLTPTGYDALQAGAVNPNAQITSPTLFSAIKGKITLLGTASGDGFQSYSIQVGEGINPDNWLQIGETQKKPVKQGQLGTWDTGNLNGLYAIRLVVITANNQMQTAVSQVTVDNTPPVAEITYPLTGSQMQPVQGVITLNARVEDAVGIDRVEWWLDGKKAFETSSAPYLFIWQATTGKHTLQIKAWDTAGNQTDSSSVQFTVNR